MNIQIHLDHSQAVRDGGEHKRTGGERGQRRDRREAPLARGIGAGVWVWHSESGDRLRWKQLFAELPRYKGVKASWEMSSSHSNPQEGQRECRKHRSPQEGVNPANKIPEGIRVSRPPLPQQGKTDQRLIGGDSLQLSQSGGVITQLTPPHVSSPDCQGLLEGVAMPPPTPFPGTVGEGNHSGAGSQRTVMARSAVFSEIKEVSAKVAEKCRLVGSISHSKWCQARPLTRFLSRRHQNKSAQKFHWPQKS